MDDKPQPQPPYGSTPPRRRAWPWVILAVIIACLVITLPLAALLGMGWLSYSTVQNMQATTTAGTQVAQTAQAVLAGPPEGWTLAVDDDFSHDTRAWDTGTTTYDWVTAQRYIVAGEYQWGLLPKAKGSWWETYELRGARYHSDFYLSADVQQVKGLDITANNHGLVFRENFGNFYVFVVSEDQFVGVLLLWQGEWERLIPWTSSDAIRPGEMNHLAVLAEDTRYTFFVNNQLVAELDADRLTAGDVGLFVNFTDDPEGEYVNFDNFKFYHP